jgi:prephenate dehydrogenase
MMRIAVFGCGRMGAWFARELAHENVVVVFDRDEERTQAVVNGQSLRGGASSTKNAQSYKANAGVDIQTLDEITQGLACTQAFMERSGGATGIPSQSKSPQPFAAIKPLLGPADLEAFQPDLFLNTVTLGQTREAFAAAEPHLPDACTWADVASIKGDLLEFYTRRGRRWASVHPMFGPGHADMDSPAGENAIILAESDPTIANLFQAFFKIRGVRVFTCPAAEHDRWMSYSLTMPFLVSMAFAGCLEGAAPPGTTFRRQHGLAARLLAEDNQLLTEILFNPYSLPQLERLTDRLEFLKHILRGRDFDEASRFFEDLRGRLGQ